MPYIFGIGFNEMWSVPTVCYLLILYIVIRVAITASRLI